MNYKAHENLVASARKLPDTWRTCLGIVAVVALTVGLTFAYMGAAVGLMGSRWVADAVNTGTSPQQVLFMLLHLGVAALAVIITARFLHQRSFAELVGTVQAATLQFILAMRGLIPVIIVFLILTYTIEDLQPNLNFGTWLLFLPLALPILLIQTGSEELVFRGYLQSQLASLNLHPLIWILIPSILFGLIHYDPASTGPELAPYIVVWATLFGICAADLTARTGTLGPAIAFHFANNTMPLLFVGFPDYLSGMALNVYPFPYSATEEIMSRLPLDLIGMAIMYISVRIGVRR